MTRTTASGELRRHLRLSDAVIIGCGSMIGAGVYSVWPAASESAGSLLLVGLLLAALVALANARSSARLASLYPESGGTYVYGRERLGPRWGFIAGWGFVVGKTASCAAMASTIGAYVLPEHARLTAVIGIVAITAVNLGGLQRTVAVTKILLAVSAVILLIVVVSASTAPGFSPARAWPGTAPTGGSSLLGDVYGVLQAAGILFFAFAGYARIATLGEEISNPTRTIPRAISISLASVLATYSAIAFVLLSAIPLAELGSTPDPLRRVVASGTLGGISPLVKVGALVAALGALLNLLPGVSRTVLAMARRGDLPGFLSHVDPRRALPIRAESAVAAAAIVITVIFDLRSAIALSGVGVLIYYSITNASAMTLHLSFIQKASTMLGLIGCLVLVACLPPRILITGSGVLALGLCLHALRSLLLRFDRRTEKPSEANDR